MLPCLPEVDLINQLLQLLMNGPYISVMSVITHYI